MLVLATLDDSRLNFDSRPLDPSEYIENHPSMASAPRHAFSPYHRTSHPVLDSLGGVFFVSQYMVYGYRVRDDSSVDYRVMAVWCVRSGDRLDRRPDPGRHRSADRDSGLLASFCRVKGTSSDSLILVDAVNSGQPRRWPRRDQPMGALMTSGWWVFEAVSVSDDSPWARELTGRFR